MVLVFAVLVSAALLWADIGLNRVEAIPAQRIGNTAGTNWLIVGSDSRAGLSAEDEQRLGTGGEVGGQRTDTIMLLHLPRVGKPTLVSIPRDSFVPIPGYDPNKINAAYAFGGPQLLAETVEDATGLRIDHYAEIGMGGLAALVDVVGGVEMCPEESINDPLANINISAGCQKFDGPKALGYVRTRATAQGDLDRVRRQREFLSALLSQITSPTTLLNPLRAVPLLAKGPTVVTVDEGDHIWNVARLALAMGRGVKTETVPIGSSSSNYAGAVLLWDEAAAEELFSSLR